VLTDEQKKVFQIILNVQKVEGDESSYENRAPPIGEAKAALTPAEIPAHMNSLLCTSF
jgi:hypothetical protein